MILEVSILVALFNKYVNYLYKKTYELFKDLLELVLWQLNFSYGYWYSDFCFHLGQFFYYVKYSRVFYLGYWYFENNVKFPSILSFTF